MDPDPDDHNAHCMLRSSRPFLVSLGVPLSSAQPYPHRAPTFPVAEDAARYVAMAQSTRQGWQHKYLALMLSGHLLRCWQIPPWMHFILATTLSWTNRSIPIPNFSIMDLSTLVNRCPLGVTVMP
ncbi:hypothetical protein IG631_22593 [Alternaria alternata]|nr:hypothetical protein IG631_22593 [Alternaria alternata]